MGSGGGMLAAIVSGMSPITGDSASAAPVAFIYLGLGGRQCGVRLSFVLSFGSWVSFG
jgi:hypothetical protein